MTAKTTKSNKRTLSFMQDNPTHPLFQALETQGVNTVFNKLTDDLQDGWVTLNSGGSDSKWNELLYNEMREHNSDMRGRPYSYERGNEVITVDGNTITITKRK